MIAIERVELKEETRVFLRDWLAWVDRGAPAGEPYERYWGLCYNGQRSGAAVLPDLDNAFVVRYPFGLEDYIIRSTPGRATLHECPNRLAWAKINS